MAKVDLQFWKREGVGAPVSAALSTIAHAALIGLWVFASLPRFNPPPEETFGRVLYFPPPNPNPALPSSTESIRYVELAPEGDGSGFGPVADAGVELDAGRLTSRLRGNLGRDSTTAPEETGQTGTDTVFTIIEVDTAATRLPESAAPRYPPDLLQKRIMGQAIVRFVVDTTGLADPNSFSVVLASHQEFAESVRQALPGMRFAAARIGNLKVRQLVELPFTFNIATPPPDTAAIRAATTRRRPE